jgi:excisionase family DNA binding protein
MPFPVGAPHLPGMTSTTTLDGDGGRGGGVSPLLTAQDVAEMLGVPASWVYAQTRARLIPTVKLGRYYRYRTEAIQEWIASREEVGA